MRSALFVTTLIGTLVGAWPSRASADVVQFIGPHPVSPTITRGMCHIEGPHVHAYRPYKTKLHVRVGPAWVFVGDPVEFEPAAPKYGYYGHHPVFWVDEDDYPEQVEAYCYISGPHHHWYAPPSELRFTMKGGVYWFVGEHPRWYRTRWRRHRHIDRYYGHVTYERPVVTVAPPHGFVGVVAGPGGVRAGAHVAPPTVEVNIPVPTIGISIGGGRPVRHHYRRGAPHPPPPPRYRRVRHYDGDDGEHEVEYKYKYKRKKRGYEVKYKEKHKGNRGRGRRH